MATVFPENMSILNVEDSKSSLKTLEDYVQYMQERIDFSISHLRADYITVGNIGGDKGLIISEDGITFGPNCKISWSSIDDKPTIPDSTSDLINDSGFIDSEVATTITRNTVTTSYVNALNVSAYNIKANSLLSNSFKIGKDATNYAMNFDGYTGTITFGSDVTMAWSNITGKQNVLETSDITKSGGYVTAITGNSIQSNSITASAMSAITIDASQITTGTLIADAIVSSATIYTPTINLGTTGVIYGSTSSTALYYDGTYGWYFSGKVTIGENTSGANLDVGWNLYVGNQLSVYGNTFLHSTPSLSTSFTSIGVNASGQVGINGSARRFKNSIELVKDNSLNPKGLYDIDIVQFKWNEDMTNEPDKLCIGMIAEDVAEHFPIAARYNEEGQVMTWETREFIAPIIKLLQEQNERLKVLENGNFV